MARYVEDLVQNIYTKCDMAGLDKLNQGLRDAIWYSGELEKNIKDVQMAQRGSFNFHAQAINAQNLGYKEQSNAIRLLGVQNRENIKTAELQLTAEKRRADLEETLAIRKKRRDVAEARRLQKRNVLLDRGGKLLGAYFGFQTLRNIVDTGARLQMLQRSVQGLTGSGKDWQFIEQQALKYGVSLNTVAMGYRNFYSSAKMAGFNSQQIQGMYGDLLLSTRSIGASSEQTGGALLALEQMISKGTVSMEELRRQLGNSIPGAFEIGAKAMNMTTQQFNDFVTHGKLASNVFVPLFIKQLKKTYAGGWKDVEQTVSVAMGRVGAAWEKLTMDFLHGESGKALAKGLNELVQVMMSPDFYKFIRVLGQIFTLVVKILTFAIRHIKELVLLLGIGGLTGVLLQVGAALKVAFNAGIIVSISRMATAVKGLMTPFTRLYLTILIIISALLILQDLWVAIFHPDWDSVIGGWAGKPKFSQPKETGGMIFGDTEQIINQKSGAAGALQGFLWGFQDKYGKPGGGASNIGNLSPSGIYTPSPSIPIIPTGSAGYMGTLPSVGDLTKTSQSATTVTIGDINVYSNSSNPQAVAEEVNKQLIAMLMGQSVMVDARGVV